MSRRAFDTGRLGSAAARPGIDPRVWATYAEVTALHVSTEGVFVDVLLLPDEIPETARVGSVYAGPGFGLYSPPRVGAEVLVVSPSGDPNEGLVVVGGLWEALEPPPAEATGDEAEQIVVLRVQDGARLRLITVDADTVIEARGTGNVQVQAGRDIIVQAERDVTVTAGRDVSAAATRNVAVTAQGKVDVTAQGNATVITQATALVQAATAAKVVSPRVVAESPSVELGAETAAPTDGVVQGLAVEPFTGMTALALGWCSTKVKAVK